MRRIPVIPTIIVIAAIATMIWLGNWQLQRKQWKESLLAEYAQAEGKPAVEWPRRPDPDNLPLFRKSLLDCAKVLGWRSTSGRNINGQPGVAHIATCALDGAGDDQAQVVMGWSKSPANPDWTGGKVSGTIAPDSRHQLRLVADTPADGFITSQPPQMEDVPNNHLAYAVQWFVFAFIAAVIYILALKWRKKARV